MQPKSQHAVLLLPLLLLPLAACSASGPRDTRTHAQRPFLSRDTHTTADKIVAAEVGLATVAGHEQQIPVALRYGMGTRSELYLETSPYSSVDRPEGQPDGSGWGDTTIGIRHRLRDADIFSPAYGFQMQTKLPTGRPNSGLGSGETDWFGALMATQSYYEFKTTAFYQLGILGEPDSPNSNLEHTLAVQTRKEVGPHATAFGEFVFIDENEIDRTETTLMGGLSIGLDSVTSVDLAIRVGLGDDAEDFQVLVGISRALGMLFFPDDEVKASLGR